MRRERRIGAGGQAGRLFPFAFLFLAGAAFVSASQETPSAAGAPQACLYCHPQVSLEGTVHAGFTCESCHAGLVRRESAPAHQPKKDLPPPTCTASCHLQPAASRPGGSPAAYPDSVHG